MDNFIIHANGEFIFKPKYYRICKPQKIRKQGQLNALYKRLTEQEKPYFKIFALPGSGDKLFIRLFDEFATQSIITINSFLNETGVKVMEYKKSKGYTPKDHRLKGKLK